MIVGVGASRVRDLFDQAKEAAPAIIFIDELDAIGRARGGGESFGGHDEREQTLNQILTEMDGFTGTEGVIVARRDEPARDPRLRRCCAPAASTAACRQPARPGGPAQILEVHTRTVPLADDVDLDAIASSHAGHGRRRPEEPRQRGGADGGARNREDSVTPADFIDALEKIVLGAERKIMLSPDERERTAYHESGHALLGMLEPGRRPGAQGLDRAARARARRHVPEPGRGPLRLRRGLPARPDRRRARRPRGRGDRVRQRHDRRRVRPRAGHARSPARWSAAGACPTAVGLVSVLPGPTTSPACSAGAAPSPSDARAGRRRGAPHRRRVLRGGSASRLRENRERLDVARRGAAGAARRSTRPTPTAPPASIGRRAPPMSACCNISCRWPGRGTSPTSS